MRRLVLVLVALLLLPALTGCGAYFNTFYFARKHYSQGQKMDRQARENAPPPGTTAASTQNSNNNSRSIEAYNRCIEQCRKVQENYPGSKWQDDASLLMSKAYFGKQDYLNARRELTSFLTRFTDSELRDEALFWLGRTEFAERDYEGARTTWERLDTEYPEHDHGEDVAFFRAQAMRLERRTAESVEAYTEFLEEYGDKDRATEARLFLGAALLEEKEYDRAEEVFTIVADRARDRRQWFEARLQLGETNEQRGDLEAALELYTELAYDLDPDVLEGRLTAEEREEIRLEQLALLEKAAEDSAFAARFETQGDTLRSGQTAPDARENEQARNDPRSVLGSQTGAPDAVQAGGAATSLVASRRTPLPRNDPNYELLAQVLLREGRVLAAMGRPQDAIQAYEQVIAEYEGLAYAAEAQFRIGYTEEVYLEDFTAAQASYGLVSRRGRSSFTEEAQKRAANLDTVKRLSAALEDSTGTAAEAASEARFIRAELYLYQQDRPERAIEEYQAIQRDFPNTDYAAKAMLAEAWVRTNVMDDRGRGNARYAEVMRKYPDTTYGQYASRVLKGPERAPKEEEFAGPPLEVLLTGENLASVAKRDSVVLAAMQAESDSARAVEEALLAEQRAEEELLAAEEAAAAAAVAAREGAGGGSSLDLFAVPSSEESPIRNAWERDPQAAGRWGSPVVPETRGDLGLGAEQPGGQPAVPGGAPASAAPTSSAASRGLVTPPAATPMPPDTTASPAPADTAGAPGVRRPAPGTPQLPVQPPKRPPRATPPAGERTPPPPSGGADAGSDKPKAGDKPKPESRDTGDEPESGDGGERDGDG